MTANLQLPGVYFDVRRQRAPETLPRMDIAGFVGFAERGPLNLPVPVEDLGRFRELFGEPVALAWNVAESRRETAHLHAAVEAFFLNGGQRCWIVRVAGEDIVSEDAIPVPGLASAGGEAATCRARSPGTWARSLRVETLLRRERLQSADTPRPLAGGLEIAVAAPAEPLAPGDLLALEYAGESLVVYLAVTESGPAAVASPEPFRLTDTVLARGSAFVFEQSESSPPGEQVVLTAQPLAAALGSITARPPDRLHRLTFDLISRSGARPEQRLSGLGFLRDHPRFWADLPDDAILFARRDGQRLPANDPDLEALYDDARLPRLDLAGPAASADTWLPVGMRIPGAPIPTPEDTLVDEAAEAAARLAENGLAEFSDALFLDADLASTTASSLMAAFEHKVYRQGDTVTGLHALLGIEEIAAIAVPDALHTGWERGIPEHPFLGAPRLAVATTGDAYGRLRLAWTAVSDADRYRLEAATTPDFQNPRIVSDRALDGDEGIAPDTISAFFPIPDLCPQPYFFRVRAENDSLIGPWSNEVWCSLPPAAAAAAFTPCDPLEPAIELALTVSAGSPGPLLRWQRRDGTPLPVLSPPLEFELETASDPLFLDGDRFALDDTEYSPEPVADRLRYFRVRALLSNGAPGPWSNPVVLQPGLESGWVARTAGGYDAEPLLAVQHALIRLCAARCDAVALLSLPRHYRVTDALDHLSALRPAAADRRSFGERQVPPVTARETGESVSSVYSYAVLSHPWIRYREPAGAAAGSAARGGSLDNAITPRPPDGFTAGVFAARTRAGGAWLAPANIPLVGALGIVPELDRSEIASLAEARITAIHRTPRGVLWTGADTLSPARLTGLVNVRRLMILLRRLVLREGRRFVFEPHSADFRALVRAQLNRVLTDLYQRGAFRGRHPGEAFQLVIEDVNNPPQAVDLGRFTVDLAVAPAAPLQFLRLRLLQVEPERLTVEELS